MENLVQWAIGIGLVISLLFSEFLGIAAGGIVVPGYLALNLSDLVKVAATIGAALITFVIIRAMMSFMIIYGKRRTALMILVGFLMGSLLRHKVEFEVAQYAVDLSVVGYVIPGLIAIWMDRQGVLRTICALLVAAVMTRLVVVILMRGEIF